MENRECRNILIYGFCKYQNSTCKYHHPSHSPLDTLTEHQQEYPPDSLLPQDLNTLSLYQQENSIIQPLLPLQYHLYSSPLPHNTAIGHASIHSFFMSDNLRQLLTLRNTTIHQSNIPNLKLPSELSGYHTLYPLQQYPTNSPPSQIFNHFTSLYRATHSSDGKPYLLLRIHSFKLTDESSMQAIDSWRQISNSNIVSIHEAFTTKAFGDDSLIFCFDFHPNSITLSEKYLNSKKPTMALVSEDILWSFITQLTNAINHVHSQQLAVRVINVCKIILTGENRLRISGCGILDMLTWDKNHNLLNYQQEDLLNFGQIIVILACGTTMAVHNLSQSVEQLSKYYSPELKNVILYLLGKPSTYKSINQVVSMIAPRMLIEINNSHQYNDLLEQELSKELENGRLFRLMSKLGFINERPEFDMDPKWAETGDRYLLALFRDYVFHQVDENGAPMIEMAHVIECLNKLDVGIDEKIMLMSRDEKSCLIVSYKELKQCINQTFNELVKGRLQ